MQSKGSLGFGGMTWAERAREAAGLGAVLDPSDRRGAKNAYIDRLHALTIERLLRAAGPFERALDFGCGTGRFLRRLARHARHVTGVDRTPEMLAIAHASAPHHDLVLSASDELPFGDATFDLTLCVYILSMLDAAEFEAALGELARVNRHGATLVALEHMDNSRGLDRATYRSRLAKHGFTVTDMRAVRDGSGSLWLTLAQRFPFAAGIFARVEIARMRRRNHTETTPYYYDYAIVARKA